MDLDHQIIERIYEAAVAAGDDERASLAGSLLQAEAAYEQQRDTLRALVEKANHFVTIALSATERGSLLMEQGEHLEQMLKALLTGEISEPMLKELHFEGGAFHMSATHWAAIIVGHSLANTLRKPDPDNAGDPAFWNNVQLQLNAKDVGRVLVIVQRVSGKTPADLLNEERAANEATRRELRHALASAYCNPMCGAECICGRRAALDKYKAQP